MATEARTVTLELTAAEWAQIERERQYYVEEPADFLAFMLRKALHSIRTDRALSLIGMEKAVEFNAEENRRAQQGEPGALDLDKEIPF